MYIKDNSPHAASAGKTIIGFNVINGKEVEGDLSLIQSKSAVDSRDLVGMFPDSGENDVARAARAAGEAFRSWSGTAAEARAEIVKRTAETLETHQEKLARIVTREVGLTPREALGEVQEAIAACAYFSSEGSPLRNQMAPGGLGVHSRSVGVCGVLATGNSPIAAPGRTILPAILCGNTVVWKPSDNAPASAYLFLRAMMEAGLPPGVVNTINGRGRAGCGKHFLAGIDKGSFQSFCFVGSRALGRVVGEACGRNLIAPNLELTGRGTMVVMPDADLEGAVRSALQAAFAHAGQCPVGLGNLLLHKACAEAFKQRFMEGVAALSIGNPMSDPDVAFGPMINARVATAFRNHWEMGQQDGATLLIGGEQWTEANRDDRVKGVIAHGIYMQPCVWDGVSPDMNLAQTPVMGPSVNLGTFQEFDEAMAWIGALPDGPLLSLYTQDPALIGRFKVEARAGIISINATVGDPDGLPPFVSHGNRPAGPLALDGHLRWQTQWGSPEGRYEGITAAVPHPTIKTDWDSL